MLQKLANKLNLALSPIPPLAILNRNHIVVFANTRRICEVRFGKWYVGRVLYNKHRRSYVFSLGMDSKLMRNGECISVGFDGSEEHIASLVELLPGDTLHRMHSENENTILTVALAVMPQEIAPLFPPVVERKLIFGF